MFFNKVSAMKKFILLLSCSFIAAQTAQALSASEQLNAMRDMFAGEFQKMDENKDGVLNMEEFLKYQFKELRHAVSQSEGFELPTNNQNQVSVSEKPVEELATDEPVKKDAEPEEPVQAKGLDALSDVSLTLQAMADYDEDLDDGFDYDALLADNHEDIAAMLPLSEEESDDKVEKEKIENKDDSVEVVPEIDLSVSEEENLQQMLAAEEKAAEPQKTAAEKEAQARQLKFMLDTIKKTLPKKVDDITTWTDIEYQDNAIAYIYQADVDTSKFSAAEKEALKNSVETVACKQAYAEMCPKVKTMFINEGINMKIRYLDKIQNEISSCEFNEQTCQ